MNGWMGTPTDRILFLLTYLESLVGLAHGIAQSGPSVATRVRGCSCAAHGQRKEGQRWLSPVHFRIYRGAISELKKKGEVDGPT